MPNPDLIVLVTGPGTTVQDLGRPGYAELGVGPSGAADRPALRLANRLVGNPEGHAGLEVTLGGLRVRFARPALVAVTGAQVPVTVGGRAAGCCAPVPVRPGQEVSLGPPRWGLRSYLAVRGGIDVPAVLGSRSTDTLAGLGPRPLEVEMALPVGETPLGYPGVDLAPQPAPPERPVLRVRPGPRHEHFTDAALAALCDPAGYQVDARSNRVGIRLVGAVLDRRTDGELPPEACVSGALQVPPNGQPILFLADHPVTGGYPVIAVAHPDDLPLAAQAAPGARLRFRLAR